MAYVDFNVPITRVTHYASRFSLVPRPSDLPAELARPPQEQCSGGRSLRQARAVVLRHVVSFSVPARG